MKEYNHISAPPLGLHGPFYVEIYLFIARPKRDGTRAEPRFGLSAKRTSPFKSAGVSVQSTAGSRGVRISGQRLYRPCSDVRCKTAGYPPHSHLSPSLPHPCVTVCHQVLNTLYLQSFSSWNNSYLHALSPTWTVVLCGTRLALVRGERCR